MTDVREPDSADSDAVIQLICRARDGSQEAMAELIEACRTYLLLVANRELPDGVRGKVAPSDLVQETFIEACRGFSQFGGHSRQELLGWLRRILLNNVRDAFRHYERTGKRQLSREVSLNADSRLAIDVAIEQTSPSQAAMAEEEREALERAMKSLSERQREVIMLHHREGLPFLEISRRLGCSAEAVRKLWSRAVRKLQRQIEAPDGDE